MSSGIGRTGMRLMRALGGVLGVNDVKQAPARLKVDELVPTIGLDPGWADYGVTQLISSVGVGGTARWTWMAIGAQLAESTVGILGSGIFPNNSGLEIAILGISVQVRYNAGGAVLGSMLRIREYRQAPGAPASYVMGSQLHHFASPGNSADSSHYWTYPIWMYGEGSEAAIAGAVQAASPIWVPAGSKWGLEVDSLMYDGTFVNWPANVDVIANVIFATCPKGFRPPGF